MTQYHKCHIKLTFPKLLILIEITAILIIFHECQCIHHKLANI